MISRQTNRCRLSQADAGRAGAPRDAGLLRARAGWSRRPGHRAFGPVRILGAERRVVGLNAARRMVKGAVLGELAATLHTLSLLWGLAAAAEIEMRAPEAWALDAPAGGRTP